MAHPVQLVCVSKTADGKPDLAFQPASLSTLTGLHHVVSILGQQGTGKSTLLNCLFGTTFELPHKGRAMGPTTQGIWLSSTAASIAHPTPATSSTSASAHRSSSNTVHSAGGAAAPASDSVLVLDMEGCDARSRTDNLDRKCAMFALTVSDVLIFNIKEADTLHRKGGSEHLFADMFKIMLAEKKLQDHLSKRTHKLVVVVRDVVDTPRKLLRDRMESHFNKIWKGIEGQNGRLDELLQIKVTTLPPIKGSSYDPKHSAAPAAPGSHAPSAGAGAHDDSFDHKIHVLRDLFVGGPGRRGKPALLDGPPRLVSVGTFRDVWDSIQQSKLCNLPAYEVMLAEVKCHESIRKQLHDFKDLLANTTFGTSLQGLMLDCIESYEAEVKLFAYSEAFQGRRQKLRDDMLAALKQTVSQMVKDQVELSVARFTAELARRAVPLRTPLAACEFRPHYRSIVAEYQEMAREQLTKAINNLRVPGTDWEWNDEWNEWLLRLKMVTKRVRDEILEDRVRHRADLMKRRIADNARTILREMDNNLWEQIITMCLQVADVDAKEMEQVLVDFGLRPGPVTPLADTSANGGSLGGLQLQSGSLHSGPQGATSGLLPSPGSSSVSPFQTAPSTTNFMHTSSSSSSLLWERTPAGIQEDLLTFLDRQSAGGEEEWRRRRQLRRIAFAEAVDQARALTDMPNILLGCLDRRFEREFDALNASMGTDKRRNEALKAACKVLAQLAVVRIGNDGRPSALVDVVQKYIDTVLTGDDLAAMDTDPWADAAADDTDANAAAGGAGARAGVADGSGRITAAGAGAGTANGSAGTSPDSTIILLNALTVHNLVENVCKHSETMQTVQDARKWHRQRGALTRTVYRVVAVVGLVLFVRYFDFGAVARFLQHLLSLLAGA